MAIRDIAREGIVYARYISADEWKEGLQFFSNDGDFLQVGTWRYQKGKELLAHSHNAAPRTIKYTQEVVYVRKGIIAAEIFDEENLIIEKVEISEGDMLILLAGGHGYKVLADDTQILEIKNGPYLGADIDRRRI